MIIINDEAVVNQDKIDEILHNHFSEHFRCENRSLENPQLNKKNYSINNM